MNEFKNESFKRKIWSDKKLKDAKSVKEIQDITSLSRSTIYNTIKKIDELNDIQKGVGQKL